MKRSFLPALMVFIMALTSSVFAGISSTYHMTEFIATHHKNAVTLNWTTTFDNNKDRFEIERSTDGVFFKHSGTIKAKGSLETPHVYAFADDAGRKMTATTDLYYRLKQIDLNGNATFSNVLVVRVYKTKALRMVSATPNPVFNNIDVSVQLNENAFMVAKVTDESGMEILRKSAKGNRGVNNFSLDGTNRLQQGIYFLEVIIDSKERMVIKLIRE